MEQKGIYEGIFPDTFFKCLANSEEEAQRIMKKMLIEQIMADDEPLIVWFSHYEPPNPGPSHHRQHRNR